MNLPTEPTYYSFFFWFHDTDHYGIVTGQSAQEIFDVLDEYGDPYQCKISPVKNGAAVYYKFVAGEEEDHISEYELSEAAQIDCNLENQSEWIWFKDWFEAEGGEINEIDQERLGRGNYKGKALVH